MFGYVIADLGRLTEAQRLRYHSVYCGLCRALYADYGAAGALRAACATRSGRSGGQVRNSPPTRRP